MAWLFENQARSPPCNDGRKYLEPSLVSCFSDKKPDLPRMRILLEPTGVSPLNRFATLPRDGQTLRGWGLPPLAPTPIVVTPTPRRPGSSPLSSPGLP